MKQEKANKAEEGMRMNLKITFLRVNASKS